MEDTFKDGQIKGKLVIMDMAVVVVGSRTARTTTT